MTVKELKDFVASIDTKFDNREIVMDGFGSYTSGYNPLNDVSIKGMQVTENFPTDKADKKSKNVCLFSIY